MPVIKLTYNPKTGLVQSLAESPGLFLGGNPISYSYALESVRSITGDYTVANESFIIADASSGAITVTLPAITAGRMITIKKIDSSSNTVTIIPDSSETLDGGSNVIVNTQWTSVTFQAISGNWYIK